METFWLIGKGDPSDHVPVSHASQPVVMAPEAVAPENKPPAVENAVED